MSTNWRVAYKLMKQFGTERPEPCKVAEALKAMLDRFKGHIPLIVALSNKGMRERHWTQISQVIGFELRPTSEGSPSLRQLLR